MKRFFYCCLIAHTFFCVPLRAQQENIRISGSVKLPDICIQLNDTKDSSLIPGLYLLSGNTPAAYPVAGHHRRSGNTVCYTPMYPLAAGAHFLVRAAGHADTILSIPADKVQAPSVPAAVAAIYPLADSIPKNILFFHVRFTQAMWEDLQAWKKIMILDDSGKLIQNTWRQRSFWLDSGRLLVLMIHPGRVKSGIRYIGPVFETGRTYTLVADSTLKDAYGRSLSAPMQHTYSVVPDLKEKLSVKAATAKLRSGTMEAVQIELNNAADHAAAFTGITVADPTGKALPFSLAQGKGNTLLLHPVQAWIKGRYRIQLAGTFYDCAGNRFNRLFEMKSSETFRDDDKIRTLDLDVE